MRYVFHPEALEEYREAANWYADREPELGLRFIEAVEAAVQQVIEAPARWRVIDEDVQRCLTRVFPYGLLYTIEKDFILIVAVMHCSREPGYWKSRVAPQAKP
jgi:plasmid stabilization system protein ParE